MKLSFVLNGRPVAVETAPDRRAVDLLRELGALGPDLKDAKDSKDSTGAENMNCISDMKDVKEGCGTGECGACSVLVDGVHKLSCLLLAAQLEGRELTTPSGLGTPEAPHAIQRAFAERGAVQCGFCSPGMTIAAAALLAENPAPAREEIRRAISGNLCRCTGYVMIVDAVEAAAKELRRDTASGNGPGPAPGNAAGRNEGTGEMNAASKIADQNRGRIPGRKAGKP